MDRIRRTALPAGLLLALSALPLAHAQAPTPAAPIAPAPGTPPPAPVAPTAENLSAILNDALAQSEDAKQQMKKAQEVMARVQASGPFYFGASSIDGLSDKRIDLDLKNASLRDALKQALDAAQVTYTIDDDVPNDPKVTLKISKAPLPAVLDLLTESNGIGWRSEIKANGLYTRTLSATSPGFGTTLSVHAAPDTKDARPEKSDGKDADKNDRGKSDKDKPSPVQIHIGKTIASTPHNFRLSVMDVNGAPWNMKLATPPVSDPALPRTYLRKFNWQERRISFTCPNCHNKVTIVRPADDETRCPTCGRTFEDDWKVCPFDGTKRPERKDTLHYCPICGKPISLDKLQTGWILEPDDPFTDLATYIIDSDSYTLADPTHTAM